MIAEIAIKKQEQIQSYWDANKVYTYKEYCELEEKAPFRSEFRNGKIIPMKLGKPNHAKVIGSLFYNLKGAVKKLNIEANVFLSEMGVYIEAINQGLYPDTTIVIGEDKYYEKGLTNPTVIIEVLSASTGNYDRGEKFKKYKLIPSFKEYVLLEQDTPSIDVLEKKENGKWEMSSFIGLDDVLELTTLDIKIPLSDIYEDVKDLTMPQYKIDLE